MATITVLSDMNTAPTAGESTIPDRREPPAGERDRYDIISGGPPKVLHHLTIGHPRQRDNSRHISWVAPHQHYVAGLNRDVRPGPDRDADVCRDQRGRVVHAIPHYRDPFPSCAGSRIWPLSPRVALGRGPSRCRAAGRPRLPRRGVARQHGHF